MAVAAKVTTRCAGEGCTWSFIGTVEDGRIAYAEHRARAHAIRDPGEPRVSRPGEVRRDPAPDPLDDIEQIRDLIGHGKTVEIRLPREPVAWRREWIESLGGRIVIDPSAPMPLAMQRDKEEPNGSGREALERMDAGEPQRAERSEMMSELIQCKIEGCHEEALTARGRYARLCAEHKAEYLAQARREGSLGGNGWHAAPNDDEPEPEPVEETALVPVPAAPPPDSERLRSGVGRRLRAVRAHGD